MDVTSERLLNVVVLGVVVLLVVGFCVVVVDVVVDVEVLDVLLDVDVVDVVDVVVTGFSATGSNVEVMVLLSSETSILVVVGELSAEMRSSTSSGSSGRSPVGATVVLRSTMLSGTVLSATAASSVLVGAFQR